MEGCSLIIHGGAIGNDRIDYTTELQFLRGLASDHNSRLSQGASALAIVVDVLRELEASGLFIAGRGASPNALGVYELDASIVDGATGKGGAVACLTGFKFPSAVAYEVLQNEREAFWVGSGAAALAQMYGCEPVEDSKQWYQPRFTNVQDTNALGFGTAGVVIRDNDGNLASGTTTGGLMSKRSGRVGDTPIIGAGSWADRRLAVSCTGDGQAFLRANAAAYMATRRELLDETLDASATAALDRVSTFNGSGALVALSSEGIGVVKHSCAGIKFAAATAGGSILVGAAQR